jgi:hypothetical protein
MLILGVGLLVVIDLTIISMYMLVEGLRGNLGPILLPFRENEEDVQGVCILTLATQHGI